jgi:hypothetical protein
MKIFAVRAGAAWSGTPSAEVSREEHGLRLAENRWLSPSLRSRAKKTGALAGPSVAPTVKPFCRQTKLPSLTSYLRRYGVSQQSGPQPVRGKGALTSIGGSNSGSLVVTHELQKALIAQQRTERTTLTAGVVQVPFVPTQHGVHVVSYSADLGPLSEVKGEGGRRWRT